MGRKVNAMIGWGPGPRLCVGMTLGHMPTQGRGHGTRLLLLAAALAIAMVAAAAADPANQNAAQPKLATTIGMQGVYYARYSGGELEAKPYEENSPITLSIAEVTPAPIAAGQPPARIYELHFIGTRAGQYDLRDYLTRVDGKPLADLEPLRVSVAALLPADFDGNLESLEPAALPTTWPYRTIAAMAATLWALAAMWFVSTRWRGRRRRIAIISELPPTLADQLRLLVAAAIAGQLSPADQARLERLLIGYWRAALRLDGLPTAEALAIMRRDEHAGELLRQIEIWLYERPGRTPIDVAAMLAPYEDAAPLPAAAVERLMEAGVR